MGFYQVFQHPEIRRYRAPLVTKAVLFTFIFTTVEIFCPLIVAYRAFGFWIKEATYSETPTVQYKYNAMMVLGTSSKSFVWSTFSNYNNLQRSNLVLPVVKILEQDANRDGRYESLNVQLSVPLADTENIQSVELLLFFDYRLSRRVGFRMESMAHIQAETIFPAASLSAYGRLNFVQDSLLGSTGSADARYNTAIVNSASTNLEDYNINNILGSYSARNVSTRFENAYYRWERNRPPGQPFTVNATVIYTTPVIKYRPGFWYVLKWAWIQYLSVLLIFTFVFERMKTFVFQNQIVSTVVERPFDPEHPHGL